MGLPAEGKLVPQGRQVGVPCRESGDLGGDQASERPGRWNLQKAAIDVWALTEGTFEPQVQGRVTPEVLADEQRSQPALRSGSLVHLSAPVTCQ